MIDFIKLLFYRPYDEHRRAKYPSLAMLVAPAVMLYIPPMVLLVGVVNPWWVKAVFILFVWGIGYFWGALFCDVALKIWKRRHPEKFSCGPWCVFEHQKLAKQIEHQRQVAPWQ